MIKAKGKGFEFNFDPNKLIAEAQLRELLLSINNGGTLKVEKGQFIELSYPELKITLKEGVTLTGEGNVTTSKD